MNILVTIPMDSQQRQTLAAIAPEAAVRYTTGPTSPERRLPRRRSS
ncbi:MAG: hypothetical protein LUD80_00040 [Clostridiales bacterium]|nr:hypothetical protein [Clostridiales bacterium]